jgi:hypothetical protein
MSGRSASAADGLTVGVDFGKCGVGVVGAVGK